MKEGRRTDGGQIPAGSPMQWPLAKARSRRTSLLPHLDAAAGGLSAESMLCLRSQRYRVRWIMSIC